MTLTTIFKKSYGSSSSGTSRFLPVLPKAMLGAVSVLLSISATASPSIYPTGTTRYDPAKAFNSFVLFTGGDNIAHLIDLNGNSVHEWKDAASHSTLIDPAVNGGKLGHVFVTLDTIEGKGTDLVPGQVNRRDCQDSRRTGLGR